MVLRVPYRLCDYKEIERIPNDNGAFVVQACTDARSSNLLLPLACGAPRDVQWVTARVRRNGGRQTSTVGGVERSLERS